MKTEISSDSLFLRAMEPQDESFLYDIENRREAFSVGENRIPFSHDYLQRFIYASLQENFLSSGQLRLVVCCGEDTELHPEQAVGILDFFNYDSFHRRAETGIVVCPGYRNKGIGEKILTLACDYARNQLNLHQLYAEVAANNEGSLKLFEKCGFERCGLRRQWLLQAGEWVDTVLWQKIFG
ncbi:MAG: GNAT family N-acetyltransferase [Bacteroides sp.]|nr:GNAT family N-acetyltransferase [Bacteroides sp.]